ncbi:MAG: hypothetical protein ACRCT7_13350 [Shewanella sp.]
MYKPKHFKTQELVPEHIYKARGEKALELIDERVLITIDTLREKLGCSITINNWMWGGNRNWSGLRTAGFYKSLQAYEDSLSQHKYGRAVDMLVKGMEASQVRQFIYDNKKDFPYVTFVETDISWVHVDCRNCQPITTWSPDRGSTGIK